MLPWKNNNICWSSQYIPLPTYSKDFGRFECGNLGISSNKHRGKTRRPSLSHRHFQRLFSFADRHPRAGVVKPQFRRMPSYLVWNHFMPSSCVAASSGGNSGEDPNKPRGIQGMCCDLKPTRSRLCPSSACEHSPPFPPSTCGSSHGCRAGRGARRSPCRGYRCQGRTWCPNQCAPEPGETLNQLGVSLVDELSG